MIRVAVGGRDGHAPAGRRRRARGGADDLDLVARIAPSLAGAAAGAYGSLSEALADARPDVAVDVHPSRRCARARRRSASPRASGWCSARPASARRTASALDAGPARPACRSSGRRTSRSARCC